MLVPQLLPEKTEFLPPFCFVLCVTLQEVFRLAKHWPCSFTRFDWLRHRASRKLIDISTSDWGFNESDWRFFAETICGWQLRLKFYVISDDFWRALTIVVWNRRFTIHLRRPWTRAFFRPASRTVGFSLRLKNSGHVMIFLWLCGLQNTDHVMPFWLFPPVAAKEKTASWSPTKFARNWDTRRLWLSSAFRFSCKNTCRGDLYFVVSAVVFCSLKCSCFRGVGETHRRFAGSFTIVLSVLTCTAGTGVAVACTLTDIQVLGVVQWSY